jgi:hypothetical protein
MKLVSAAGKSQERFKPQKRDIIKSTSRLSRIKHKQLEEKTRAAVRKAKLALESLRQLTNPPEI